MDQIPHITASCRIYNHQVIKDGKTIFTGEPGATAVDFFISVYRHIAVDYPRFYKMDPLCKLGWLASEILLSGTPVRNEYLPEEAGMVLSNANASLDTDIRYQDTINNLPSPAVFVYTLPNILIGEISMYNRFKGESVFFVNEQPDAALMQSYVSTLFGNDILKCCICGWADILDQSYEATLLLVENKPAGIAFDADNIDALFHDEKLRL